jgi:predicted DNA-binding antitoxin AbrB/MazE fold protein
MRFAGFPVPRFDRNQLHRGRLAPRSHKGLLPPLQRVDLTDGKGGNTVVPEEAFSLGGTHAHLYIAGEVYDRRREGHARQARKS